MSLIIRIALCFMFLHVASCETADKVLSASLHGSYRWEMILDVDNSQNSGSVTREIEVTKTVFSSYSDLKKSLESSEVAASIGTELGGTFFEVLQASVKSQISTEIKSVYERITEQKSDVKTETKRTDKYVVGPNGKLKLYRLVFTGPGVQYSSDTISSTPQQMDDVIIDVTVRQVLFLKKINVVYTSDSISRPSNLIQMAHGENGDINSGFGGKYVWLVPVYTTKQDEAATGIEVAVQSSSNSEYDDLAKDAGGDYRYLKILRRYSNNNLRVTDVGLWRSKNSLEVLDNGWHYKTIDINQGRGGDWLYLVYKVRSV